MTGIPISIKRVRKRERDREREQEYRNTPKNRGRVVLSSCLSSSGEGKAREVTVSLCNYLTTQLALTFPLITGFSARAAAALSGKLFGRVYSEKL